MQVPIENYNKLPHHFQEYAQRILDIGRHVKFVVQERQEGFGHAVYTAREAVGNEPFLLMLGDHLYRSKDSKNCAQQLLDAYNQHGLSILGLRQTPESDIASFGTIAGIWVDQPNLLSVTKFSEKPTIDYARNNLRISSLPEVSF